MKADYFIEMDEKRSIVKFYLEDRKTTPPLLALKVSVSDFKDFLKSLPINLPYNENDDYFITYDSEIFYRALLYAVVRWSMRKYDEIKIYHLKEAVRKLPFYDLKYWFNTIMAYIRYGDTKNDLLRPAKAFRIVTGLD